MCILIKLHYWVVSFSFTLFVLVWASFKDKCYERGKILTPYIWERRGRGYAGLSRTHNWTMEPLTETYKGHEGDDNPLWCSWQEGRIFSKQDTSHGPLNSPWSGGRVIKVVVKGSSLVGWCSRHCSRTTDIKEAREGFSIDLEFRVNLKRSYLLIRTE